MRKINKTLVLFAVIVIMAIPAYAVGNVINLTPAGLGLTEGNLGTSFLVDNIIIGARTSMNSDSYGSEGTTGTVYLSPQGLGVQTLSMSGSDGISGKGEDQDEALIFNFSANIGVSSLKLGLNQYRSNKDNPVLTLSLNGLQNNLVFTKESTNWAGAVTSTGNNSIEIDFGTLLGSNYTNMTVASLSVMETSDHTYVNKISYGAQVVPEPATVGLLAIGMLIFLVGERKK